ncbi:hypothetical protein LCGC14_1370090 [marine sediment metagenome]|uniref:ASCH domain-containing protein n=1 Tax=marine sediment metagenome TaxID=412755 RepID=A0A0F9KRK1_9ZZZZ
MSDKPLVLTRPNVCAVLERRKFQTRRIINPQPVMERIESFGESWAWRKSDKDWFSGVTLNMMLSDKGLLLQVGDRAYVAEGYQITENTLNWVQGKYIADDKEFKVVLTSEEHNLFIDRKCPHRKTPGRFMYKSLARIFLPIVEVRVERLQDISWEDVESEGLKVLGNTSRRRLFFKELWNSIHGKGAWGRNDWVFVYRWDEIIIKGE